MDVAIFAPERVDLQLVRLEVLQDVPDLLLVVLGLRWLRLVLLAQLDCAGQLRGWALSTRVHATSVTVLMSRLLF